MMLPKNLQKLIDNYSNNAQSNDNLNETQLRREYLDKFISCLGWDVSNDAGKTEKEKDVIHEYINKSKVPDYAIQFNKKLIVFIEAKKPAVNIDKDMVPSFQARRYGWSAKLPFVILSNFKEIAVYDTTLKPKEKDKSVDARVFYCKFNELGDICKISGKNEQVTNWSYLYSIFSKDAVISGSFEKHNLKNKKIQTKSVDDDFLETIEKWRDKLAKNISKNNNVNVDILNYSVQKIIDRIIFLRIAEDRGIEEENILSKLIENKCDTYKNLIGVFKRADNKYNSGLFHFDKSDGDMADIITPSLLIDDNVLKEIIKDTYYPAPYSFVVMPADILGSIYERFLGKVIRLTSPHNSKIEEKPEVRKSGGVYYTPSYIVEYIVQNTIGNFLKNKKIDEIENLTILDPACGSGSFLIVAYQYLLDWYLEKYLEKKKSNIKKGIILNGRLSTSERKRILLKHIYGVDIDSQAVEVTKLSLLLKAIESYDSELLLEKFTEERVLPNLNSNIKCGNSLVGSDFYNNNIQYYLSPKNKDEVNAFDWEYEFPDIFNNNGFDIVIGNPPYGAELTDTIKNYVEEKYDIGVSDTYDLFIIQSIKKLLKSHGYFSFIIPRFIQFNKNAEKLRLIMLDNGLYSLVEVGQCFKDAKTECLIFLYQKDKPCDEIKSYFYYPRESVEFNNTISNKIIKSFPNSIINTFISKAQFVIAMKMIKNCIALSDHNKLTLTKRGMENYKQNTTTDSNGISTLIGEDVQLYSISDYRQNISRGCKEAIRLSNIFMKNKILVRRVSNRLTASIDYKKRAFTKNLYAVYDSIYDLEFLLGVINSKALTFFLKKYFTTRKEDIFPEIVKYQLDMLPIPKINFDSEEDLTLYNKLIELVKLMLQLKEEEQMQKSNRVTRDINSVDIQINRIVYQLYKLTVNDIKIIEER